MCLFILGQTAICAQHSWMIDISWWWTRWAPCAIIFIFSLSHYRIGTCVQRNDWCFHLAAGRELKNSEFLRDKFEGRGSRQPEITRHWWMTKSVIWRHVRTFSHAKKSPPPITAFDRGETFFFIFSWYKNWAGDRWGAVSSTPWRQMPTTFFLFCHSVMGIER